MKIPIAKPYFGEEERRLMLEPLDSGWVVQGPKVAEFENLIAAFAGVPHAVASTSCTTSLHLAVAALELRPGDEVIVPAFTWVSTANVVEYMGATPVFCDVSLDTFNMDPAAAGALITDRTVGILPVHLFGLCADMDPIMALAEKHGLWVIEDAACALGGRYRGTHAGAFGNAGCFSFHPRKSITTGEGGALTTRDDALAAKTRSLRDHGATRSDLERHGQRDAFLLPEYPYVGFNYRMTDLQGALGVAQMGRASEILGARATQAARYTAALEDVAWLRAPHVPEGSEHGWQAYVSLFVPEEPSLASLDALHARRNAMMRRAEDNGVSTRQGTHAAALTAFYAQKYGLTREQFPNTALAEGLTVTLPMYHTLTEVEQDYVLETLQAAYDA